MKTVLSVVAVLITFAYFGPAIMLQADEHVYVYPSSLKATDNLSDGPDGDPIKLDNSTSFVWVDLMPEARFVHPSLYILMSGKKARVIEGKWWPVLNGERILYGVASPQIIHGATGDESDKVQQLNGQGDRDDVRQTASANGRNETNSKATGECFGNVIRPRKVTAEVEGCEVSKPGTYEATKGDLIQIEYTYPVVPGAIPRKLAQETDKGAIYTSEFGIRHLVVPQLLGSGTYAFFFEAKHEGKGTAIVVIDNVKYEYVFEVRENPDGKLLSNEAKKPAKSNQTDMWRAWATAEGTEPQLTVEGIYAKGGPGLVARLNPAVPQGFNPRILLLDLTLATLPGVWPTVVTPIPACYVQAPYKKGQYKSVQIRYPDGHTESIREIIGAGNGPKTVAIEANQQ